MLVVFPLGLLATAVAFDVITKFTSDPRWTDMAFYLIGAGIVMGLAAALFGLIDYTAIPSETRAKRIATFHGVGNVIVVALFAASWYVRRDDPAHPARVAYWYSSIAICLALVTGWLGGELVDRLGVGVDDGANLNAPSSLGTREPAASHMRRV